MTWTYLPPGLDDFFAGIGRPREPGEPAPEPFARPADVHAIEAKTGYGAPIEGRGARAWRPAKALRATAGDRSHGDVPNRALRCRIGSGPLPKPRLIQIN